MALVSSGKSADKLATGTTGQRPSTGLTAGQVRFNTTISCLEVYNGIDWECTGGGASVHIGPPSSLNGIAPHDPGDLWYNTDDGMLYIYYTDANSSQWVDASPSGGAGGAFVEIGGDTMTGDLTVPSLNGGPLAGFRNIIINGDLIFNQRTKSYSSVSNGQYFADRWKKVSGGMTQIVEGGNFIPNTVYTLSGINVPTRQLTSPGGGHWTIPTLPSNAKNIQLEIGSVATPFEFRQLSVERDMCQVYFNSVDGEILWDGVVGTGGDVSVGMTWYYTAQMRAMPTLSIFHESGTAAGPVHTMTAKSLNGVLLVWEWKNTSASTRRRKSCIVNCDAEL